MCSESRFRRIAPILAVSIRLKPTLFCRYRVTGGKIIRVCLGVIQPFVQVRFISTLKGKSF